MSKTSVIFGLMLLAGVSWSCGDQGRGAAGKYNVLLITLDTVRADRLGCYGHESAETPALDALAAGGALFERAFTPIPITLPSHVTMMSGLYPPEHGIRENDDKSLGRSVTTLAEIFKQQGYSTGAFIGAFVLNSVFGLDQGFDTYNDDWVASSNTLDQRLEKERPAGSVTDQAISWLERNKSSPFFCWAHFFDAHSPYLPPPPYGEKFAGRPYDGEVAYMDSQVRRLMEWLEEENLTARTLVVIAGDHGEGLGDHDELRHAFFLYNTTLNVPLIFSLPGVVREGAVVKETVGLADILPTIVDLLGFDAVDQVSGRSLAGALGGGNAEARYQYGETNYPFDYYGWSPLRSLTTPRWKYIQAPRPELYDMTVDSAETENLADENPEVLADLDKKLVALEAGMVSRKAKRLALSEEDRQRLVSLGYAAGGTGDRNQSVDGKLRDPKEMADALNRWIVANDLVAEGKRGEAVAVMKAVVEEYPDMAHFQATLANTLMLAREFEEAAVYYRAALKSHETLGAGNKAARSLVHSGYAKSLVELGRIDHGIVHFEKAVKLNPGRRGDRNNLATLLLKKGRLLESALCFRQALDAEPENKTIRDNLKLVLQQLSMSRARYDEGVRLLRKGIFHQATDLVVVDILARVLAACSDDHLRDSDRAVELAEKACRVSNGRNPVVIDTLAIAHASAGRFDEAIARSIEAMKLAEAAGDTSLAGAIAERIDLYRSHEPYRIIVD